MRFEPVSFIRLLESCNCQLWQDGGNIIYRGPPGFATDPMRETAKRNKPALLPLLPPWEGSFDAHK